MFKSSSFIILKFGFGSCADLLDSNSLATHVHHNLTGVQNPPPHAKTKEIHSCAANRSSFDSPFNTSLPSRYLSKQASITPRRHDCGFISEERKELQFQLHEGIMRGWVGLLRGNPKKSWRRERDRIEAKEVEGPDQANSKGQGILGSIVGCGVWGPTTIVAAVLQGTIVAIRSSGRPENSVDNITVCVLCSLQSRFYEVGHKDPTV